MSSAGPGSPLASSSTPTPTPVGPGAGVGAAPQPTLPFRPPTAPFRTDVVRRTALSTATLLRTSKAGGRGGPGGAGDGPGGLASASADLLGGEDGTDLTPAQLAKLEENVNVKIDNDLQILLDGFRQIVGLSLIRDKDRYVLAQESYQAEMRAHNMVRAAQSLTLLSASLKLSLILSLEPAEDGDTPPSSGPAPTEPETGPPSSAKELIRDTERLRRRCAELLGAMGVGQGPGHARSGETFAGGHLSATRPPQQGNADDTS